MKPLIKKKNKLIKKVSSEKEIPKYNSLKDVVDYTRPLTIFYSGVENETYLDILYDLGIRNFLMSYEYLRGKGTNQLKKYSDMSLFIDSGAFTYMSDPKYLEYTNEQWEKQILEYLRWAERHKDSIFAIADLDLQYVVGNEKVYEWRKKYFEPFMLRTGIPVCFIYHDEGEQYWEYMCKRYPYVGFSLATDDSSGSDLMNKFKIAEKHNALVQGMASTRTSMLQEFPFYTVDSTTWLVGLKYGEISVWNGTKMSRAKKTELDSKVFPIISKYDKQFDFDLIRQEDPTEMIRVNAYAFVEAEKVIHERLKSKMYWFKSRVVKVDLDNLPDDFFPPSELLKTSDINFFKPYAQKMNINPEYVDLANLIYDVTVFTNWYNNKYSKEVEWYSQPEQEALIETLHDDYINRIVSTKDEKILDLQNFFKECISGDNERLLHLGTNFDRVVKERESYIEEEEFEVVDLTVEEVRDKVRHLLPLPVEGEVDDGSDINNLDEEIFKNHNIVPSFDSKGKFLKGQTVAKRPKKVYSEKFPKYACDTCYAASKCPEYKAGTVCAYSKLFTKFDTRNMSDIIQAMQGMVNHNLARMTKEMVMETIMGVPSNNVTNYINQNTRLLAQIKTMYDNASPEVLKQTKITRADGTVEETTAVVNPQSGGILEKLFGNMGNSSEEQEEYIEVDSKVINSRYTDEEEY